ncbi:HAMP domain-containing histidine kinase [Paenibacillus hemerocallicola]|uniref:histidine kinase n=1 Tax=Paenibacillus hemerocallicola TaxID=1172614 RepID=A0A5C4SZG7_9BACL|nr:HAMP domain-containing sensor histidine kinase [Paenibacillus hemerocallicola]TNJ61970.1 HAMP domain-containing histidine kinase [Paenibacillus hemerocallicola]
MKNKPLFVQIWLVITTITTGIALLLLLAIPLFLGSYFTREIYRTIEEAQNSLLSNRLQDRIADRLLEDPAAIERDQEKQNIRTVRHLFMTPEGRLLPNPATLPTEFKQLLAAEAREQTLPAERYEYRLNGEKMYYVIRAEAFRGRKLYVLSYMWDEHRNKLVKELSFRLSLIMGLILLFSWIPALWLAKYLSRPLVKLENDVKHLADRNRTQPIGLDRKDEFGRLAHSMEQARQQLIRQDETQQTLLQHISHELKTPVMVIRSYAQSIQDGIYPKGSLQTSVEVIDQEAERLGNRIRSLLYLTKLDYYATYKPVTKEPFRLDRLTEQVVERLRWRRPELTWTLRMEPLVLQGDPDQWTVALENLLDNQIRYARSRITVTSQPGGADGGRGAWTVSNDGPPIEPELMDDLFGHFRSGANGEFGLGLAIVKRIAELHQASVQACNEPDGVRFRVLFE